MSGGIGIDGMKAIFRNKNKHLLHTIVFCQWYGSHPATVSPSTLGTFLLFPHLKQVAKRHSSYYTLQPVPCQARIGCICTVLTPFSCRKLTQTTPTLTHESNPNAPSKPSPAAKTPKLPTPKPTTPITSPSPAER